MTAKWTETTETAVPARVEREETEYELWTRRRSAYRCVTEPATPTEIGRGLQALEPAERAEALAAAGVEPTPPATPEEIGEVLAGLGDRERAVVLAVAGVPTPDELAAVAAALPPDDRLRVLRALGAKPTSERTPEALGAELAALDVCEFLRAARAAGIVEARRLPRSSSPPLSVGGQAVAWSEIRVSGGGLPLSPLAEARAELGELHRERDQAQAALREAQRENIATARAADRWRERAQAAEHAEREMTATADRAQAELAKAVALQDAAVNRLAVLERERDQARAELAKARALGPFEPRDVVATAGGRGCALLTERDGSTVKVTAGVDYRGVRGAVVKVNGAVWLENVLVAAHRAGVLL